MNRKIKNQISKIKIVNISLKCFSHFNFYIVILIFTLYTLILYYHPAFAYLSVQSTCKTQTLNPRVEGLISASSIRSGLGSGFGNPTGACVVGIPAQFNPSKIRTYEELKSQYYTQSKATKIPPDSTSTTITAVANNTVYNYTNTSGVSVGFFGALAYDDGIAIIFIDKNLSIDGDIRAVYSSSKKIPVANMGLVIVVGGDINIAPGVTQIDAVLISEGYIYTAGAGCITNNVDKLSDNITPINALTVNGSLISLNPSNPIKFCRTLGIANSSTPAEKINQQPKYLVILKDLFAETWQKWSEIQ